MVKAVIFDIDGVMLDSEPLFSEGRKHIFEKYNLSAQNGSNISGSGMLTYWQGVISANGAKLDPYVLSRENFDYVIEKIADLKIQPTAGFINLIKSLKTKYRLAVGSSSHRYYVEFVLKYLGVRDYFEGVVCGDEVVNSKPSADIYLKVLSILGLKAEDCFVIEDSTNGIRASVNAGIPCIAFDAVTPATQNFTGCTAKFNTMNEIEKYLLDL